MDGSQNPSAGSRRVQRRGSLPGCHRSKGRVAPSHSWRQCGQMGAVDDPTAERFAALRSSNDARSVAQAIFGRTGFFSANWTATDDEIDAISDLVRKRLAGCRRLDDPLSRTNAKPSKRPEKWWARQGLNLRPHPCERWGYGQSGIFRDQKSLEKQGHLSKLVSISPPMFFILVSYVSYKGGPRMPDLSKIGEREKLKPRSDKEPHWQRLRAGWYVGYRPSRRGGRGTGLPAPMMKTHASTVGRTWGIMELCPDMKSLPRPRRMQRHLPSWSKREE